MSRIRVAKTGGGIGDAAKDLVLDSDITSLMIIDQQAKSGAVTEVTHGLGYYPVVIPFFNDGTYWHPGKSMLVGYADVSVDLTKMYVEAGGGYDWMYFLIGNAADGSVGTSNNNAAGKLKLVKDTYDCEVALDIRQYQFCSSSDLFKTDPAKSGNQALTTSAGNWEPQATIPHNLGYVPYCEVFDTDLGGDVPLDYGDGLFNYYYYMDATNLYIGVSDLDQTSPMTYNFKYQIYRNKIA